MQNTLRSKLVFKDYNHNQNLLLPPSLEELILPNHPVRIVNQVVDNLNLDPILAKYEGGGCPPYHPRLMLKVLVYGYLILQQKDRAVFAAEHPLHVANLIIILNRFRSDRLRGVLREVFSQVVLLLVDHGHITLKEAYLDSRPTQIGTPLVKVSRERIKKQLKELWSYAEQVAREELEHNEPEISRQSILRKLHGPSSRSTRH
jgi:hypothetical protein